MSLQSTPALELSGVSKRYGSFQAVHPIDLAVGRGSTYALLGPNGAGKTTTIRMTLRIIQPDTGEVRILGKPQSQEGLDRIGYLPEERGVYRRMKVRALLSFFAELKGVKPRDSRPKIDHWLERMDLASRADARLQELSKGMQQKVQFIGSILHDPEIVILDEPFSGLDPLNQRVLREIIADLKKAGRTIVFSTHIIEHAERLCDHVAIIARGAKVADGTIEEVKAQHGTRYTALRIGDADTAKAASIIERGANGRSVTQRGREFDLAIDNAADARTVLEQMLAEGVEVERFELAETSLEQIFIERVAAREREIGGAPAHV